LGSLWAASEIVLGSFLHNLKIPFRSNILTAIAIMLLIAVSKCWKDKGLYWRSGLVCALMKSISPSAIIFGPMMAIFMEGLLMEIAIRIFKHNLFGFMIAGTLAMSWNLLQFLLNHLIFYGYQIFDLYKSSIQYIEKQIHLYTVSPSQVLAIILVFLTLTIRHLILNRQQDKYNTKLLAGRYYSIKPNKIALFLFFENYLGQY